MTISGAQFFVPGNLFKPILIRFLVSLRNAGILFGSYHSQSRVVFPTSDEVPEMAVVVQVI